MNDKEKILPSDTINHLIALIAMTKDLNIDERTRSKLKVELREFKSEIDSILIENGVTDEKNLL